MAPAAQKTIGGNLPLGAENLQKLLAHAHYESPFHTVDVSTPPSCSSRPFFSGNLTCLGRYYLRQRHHHPSLPSILFFVSCGLAISALLLLCGAWARRRLRVRQCNCDEIMSAEKGDRGVWLVRSDRVSLGCGEDDGRGCETGEIACSGMRPPLDDHLPGHLRI